MSDCTPEQKALIHEILSIKKTDYYRVLKVEKSANDVEIKKSYRKLAIKLHPDKNKHPKASDAFKVIAKAFEVLSDESKRKIYDMTGADPDSRGGMGGGGPRGPGSGMNGYSGFQGFQGFQGFPPGAGMGGGNINEDILNMLFGMGGMGGNGFSFNFGGNGFPSNGFYYSNTPGMNARRRAQQQQQHQHQRTRRNQANGATQGEQPWTQYIIQFLPLIIIMVSILINSFGSSGNDGGYKNVREFHGSIPRYDFHPTGDLKVERNTPKYDIKYYVSENTMKDFEGRKSPEKELKGLDKFVENKYVETLNYGCIREKNIKREMIDSAHGIFFNDWDKIERAEKMNMPHCDQLISLNLL